MIPAFTRAAQGLPDCIEHAENILTTGAFTRFRDVGWDSNREWKPEQESEMETRLFSIVLLRGFSGSQFLLYPDFSHLTLQTSVHLTLQTSK